MIHGLASIVLLLGPVYRYLRATIGFSVFDYLPFALQAVLAVIVWANVVALRVQGRLRVHRLDRAVGMFAALLLVSAIGVVYPLQGAEASVDFLRVFALPLAMYGAVRFSSGHRTVKALDAYALVSAVTVGILLYEFAAYNIWRIPPEEVLITRHWAEQDMSIANVTYLNPESYQLPFFGHAIRPFGPLGAPQTSGAFYLFALTYVLRRRWPHGRALVAGTLLVGMLVTMSRTAWLALVVAALIEGVRLVRRRRRAMDHIVTTTAVVAVCLALCGAFYVLGNMELEDSGLHWSTVTGMLTRDLWNYGATAARDVASGNFVQFLFGHGHGFGTFSFPDGAISGDTVAFAFVYGLGWLGAGALVWMFVVSWRCARAMRSHEARIARGWPLFLVVLALTNIHYQAVFRYGSDNFVMALLGYIGWRYAVLQTDRVSTRSPIGAGDAEGNAAGWPGLS